jgi:hypothetical protein
MTSGAPNEMRFSFFSRFMNDEARVTNDDGSPNAQKTIKRTGDSLHHSDFVVRSLLDIRHSSLQRWPLALSLIALERARRSFQK